MVFKACQILASHEILAQKKRSEKTCNIFITNLAPIRILRNGIVQLGSLFIGEGEKRKVVSFLQETKQNKQTKASMVKS